MSSLKLEVKNDSVEEKEARVERMIDRERSAVYSDHRGIIFVIYKEDAFVEDKISYKNQDQRGGN